jgi:hypothetical protein
MLVFTRRYCCLDPKRVGDLFGADDEDDDDDGDIFKPTTKPSTTKHKVS